MSPVMAAHKSEMDEDLYQHVRHVDATARKVKIFVSPAALWDRRKMATFCVLHIEIMGFYNHFLCLDFCLFVSIAN